jgi:hypothetical protein
MELLLSSRWNFMRLVTGSASLIRKPTMWNAPTSEAFWSLLWHPPHVTQHSQNTRPIKLCKITFRLHKNEYMLCDRNLHFDVALS